MAIPAAVPVTRYPERGWMAALVVGRTGHGWTCHHWHASKAGALACARKAQEVAYDVW